MGSQLLSLIPAMRFDLTTHLVPNDDEAPRLLVNIRPPAVSVYNAQATQAAQRAPLSVT